MKCKEDNHCEQDWFMSNYRSKDIIKLKDTETSAVEYNMQIKKILNYILCEVRKYDNNPFGIPLTIRFLEEAVKLPDDFMKSVLQDCE